MGLLKLVAFLGLTAAWETDDRCLRRRERRLRRHTDYTTPRERKLSWTPDETVTEKLSARQLQSANLVFHLKMYWEEGFCWQEEWRERAWCFDCNGQDCNENDLLSTQDCAETKMQEFVWIPQGNKDGRGSLKVANRNLCFERVLNQEYRLRPCDGKERQMFVGFTFVGPFELHPLLFPDICLSQHHDPKPDEKIYGVSCVDARRDNTHKWEVWWAKESAGITDENFPELTSEGTWCTPESPCGPCTGDCDIDADCDDGLECFQRFASENPWDPIPGCSGSGGKIVDYCYNPEAPSRSEETYKLITLGRDCTSEFPCAKCYGNCGTDDHCIGNLKCYQRTFNDNPWEGVPGCYSFGWQAYNYCYDAETTLAFTPGEAFPSFVVDKIRSSSQKALMLVVPDPAPEPATAAPITSVTPEPSTEAPGD
jgi:hypothetical protein